MMRELERGSKHAVMLAIMTGMFFVALNQTLVSTALPGIAGELGCLPQIDQLFTAYILAASIPALLIGCLTDRYGRRPFLLVGLVLFLAGSWLAGLSGTLTELLSARIVQGVGAGSVMASAFSAVGDLYSVRERARWQGLLGAVFGLASILGPVVGGFIVDRYPWSWVFWFSIPLGVVALLMIGLLFPVPVRQDSPLEDSAGFLRALTGLLQNHTFALSNLIVFLMRASVFAMLVYLPLYPQTLVGLTATGSGVVMMAMMLTLVSASHLGGQRMHRTGRYKRQAMTCLAIITVAIDMLAFKPNGLPHGLIYACIVLMGRGVGFGMTVFNLTLQNAAGHAQLGLATAAGQLSRQMGGVLGIAAMGMLIGQGSSRGFSEVFLGATLAMATAALMSCFLKEQSLEN